MQHTFSNTILWAVCVIAVGAAGFSLFCFLAWLEAKKEIKKMPSEPMTICEIHGMYPTRHSVTIDADVMGDEIKLCPFCMQDRVQKHKVPK